MSEENQKLPKIERLKPFHGFKQEKEDENHLYFKHPDGHEIKVSKSSFSNAPKIENTSSLPKTNYDDGGKVQPQTNDQTNQNNAGFLSSLFGGSNLNNIIASNDSSNVNQPVPSASTTSAPTSPDQNSSPSPTQNQAPSYSNFNIPSQQNSNQQNPFNQLPQASELNQSYEKQKEGATQEAAATGQQGKQEALAASQAANQLTQQNQQFGSNIQQTLDESSKVAQDVNAGHIDPNHLVNNMSTLGKMSTAIGLMLGGFGSGLTGQPNAALQFLNNEIDRDIDSQKATIGKQQGLLSYYNQRFGDVNQAAAMQKANLLGVASLKMEQAAAQSKDPLAQARATQMAQQLSREQFNQVSGIQIRNNLLNQNQQPVGNRPTIDPALSVRYLAPDDSTRSKGLQEVQEQQNIDAANKLAMDSFWKVASLNTAANRVGSPIQSQKQIDAAWDPMIDKVTKTNSGRVTPVTVDLTSSLKPGLLDNQETLNQKAQQFQAMLNTERSTPTLSSLGIHLPKGAGSARPTPNASYKTVASN